MGNTLQEIDDRVVLNLWVDSDSNTYAKTSRRIPKINQVIRRICKGRYKNILTEQMMVSGDMNFLRAKQFIEDYKPIQTTEEVTAWMTEIDVTSTAHLPSSWSANIGWSVFAYTWKTASSLTGVTWVVGTHKKGIEVRIVHELPSDCVKPFNLFHINETTGKTLPKEYLDYKFQDNLKNYWTVVGDSSDNKQYLDLFFTDEWERYWHYYYKNPTTLSADGDTTEIPGEYWVELVALLASGELLRETEQRDQGKNQLVLAYSMLLEFFDEYISNAKQYRKKTIRKKETPTHVYQRRR